MKKNHAPTLVDVAREAGVSLKTASRVLNHSINVSEKKVEKIRKVMEQLGYRPNELARGLKSRKSAAIGMIVPNLSDPFFASAIKAAQEEARANGHVVILSSSGGYADVERSEIETLVRRQIDGLVIAPADSRENHLSTTIPADLPVVTFDEPVQSARYDVVTVTNRESARQATAHMIEQHNARAVVAIGARPHLYTCAERVAGYCEAMRQAKLTPRTCLVEHENQLTAEWLEKELFASGTWTRFSLSTGSARSSCSKDCVRSAVKWAATFFSSPSTTSIWPKCLRPLYRPCASLQKNWAWRRPDCFSSG